MGTSPLIVKGNHKAGEIQGQTRQHSRLINLLGVKLICIGANKMDCGVAGYKQSRHDEIANEVKSMLVKASYATLPWTSAPQRRPPQAAPAG